MGIDNKPVKGRGAATQVPNRFLQHAYGVLHEEGVDATEDEVLPTRFIETFPKTIVNRVDSPDPEPRSTRWMFEAPPWLTEINA